MGPCVICTEHDSLSVKIVGLLPGLPTLMHRLLGGRYMLTLASHSLTFLHGLQENSLAFPTLACMVRDFLAIPASSMSIERVFSQSCHICTDVQSSLKADTISKALLSKIWIWSGLLSIPGQAKNLYTQNWVVFFFLLSTDKCIIFPYNCIYTVYTVYSTVTVCIHHITI
jgi:hypothetical protein